MEASALTHASRLGLLGRRSPLLRLQGDERLIALIRAGQERGFEALVERYHGRLLAFCRGMLKSSEDAEDVLQEVFVAAHKAILADNRPINARPWLYRIARNRCLNHLRKPVPEGQDSMDVHPHEHGASVAERVQKREDFRDLIADVQTLPDTQRTALLLREIDALSYEEIAMAMETTVPAVKSLLVRARMSLTDCTQGRHLTCDDVHLELAEAAEGLRKTSGPARAHLRRCEPCRRYRDELRRNGRALAALAPAGALAGLHQLLLGKLGLGGAKLGSGAATAGGTASTAGAGGAAASSGAIGVAGSAAAGGVGGLLGTKAVAGVATVAILSAGAVEVDRLYDNQPPPNVAATPATGVAFAGPGMQPQRAVAAEPSPRRTHEHPERAAAAADDRAQTAPVEAEVEPVALAAPAAPADDGDAAHQEDDAVAGGGEAGTGTAGGSAGGVISDPPPAPVEDPVTEVPVEDPPAPPPPPAPPEGDPPAAGPEQPPAP